MYTIVCCVYMYTQHTVYIQLVGRSSVHIHIQYTVRVYTVQCIHIYTVYTHTYVCVCVYPHTVHCTCIYSTVYTYIHCVHTHKRTRTVYTHTVHCTYIYSTVYTYIHCIYIHTCVCVCIHIQCTVRVYTEQCIHMYIASTRTHTHTHCNTHTVHCTCIYITVYIYIHFIYTDEQYTISGGIYDSFDGTKGSFDRM